jgi:hypothetical protein
MYPNLLAESSANRPFHSEIPAGIDNVQRALGDGAHLSVWS